MKFLMYIYKDISNTGFIDWLEFWISSHIIDSYRIDLPPIQINEFQPKDSQLCRAVVKV